MGEGRRCKKRVYSDDDKASALAYLQTNGGTIQQAARELGIANSTLHNWASGQFLSPKVAVRYGVIKKTLSEKLEDVAHKIIDAIPGKLDGASLKDLGTTLAQVIDKMRLLREEPTAIKQITSGRREMLERLIERTLEEFPTMSRQAVIEEIREMRPDLEELLA
jgi:hypothetical protein